MTLQNLALLRHMVDEQTEDVYGNAFLEDLITSAGSVRAAATTVWELKAAKYASLVDVSEAGASRKMSQLAAQAKAMAAYYGGGSDSGSGGSTSGNYATTRPIERV